MTSATRIPVDGDTLARLHAALEPKATYDALQDLVSERFGFAFLGAYLAAGENRFHRDPQAGGDATLPEWLDGDGISNHVAVPFAYRGRDLGRLLCPPDAAMHREDLGDLLKEHFAPALFRASYVTQTLADHRRANEQLYYLTEMTKLLGELDVDMLLVNILELTSSYLGADVGSITLRDGEGWRTAVDWGLPHEAVCDVKLTDGTPVLDRANAGREPLFLTQEDLHPDGGGHRFERLLVLPLTTTNEVLGSINLVASADGIQFGPERLEIVRPGVGLAAMALENALLVQIKLEREREQEQMALGQKIQQNLLPQTPPEVDGVDVAGHSVAAKMIGGDYFDYFTLPDGSLGLVVADVAGKGVPAGLIMTAARAMFRGAAVRSASPVEILDHVNRLMCAEDFGGRFVTAVFARIDRAAGTVTLSAAGHEPAVLYHPQDGRLEEVEIRALPMGLRKKAEYEEVVLPVAAGDILMLHSDGVNEAMDANRQQFGSERIEATIANHADGTAQDILDAIVGAVDEHIAGVPRHDDTTLIVSRVL